MSTDLKEPTTRARDPHATAWHNPIVLNYGGPMAETKTVIFGAKSKKKEIMAGPVQTVLWISPFDATGSRIVTTRRTARMIVTVTACCSIKHT
ncbi:hypothetical protein AC579_7202 [Pseudocercospora musae]|uniref:Uncharacterized protein n=1 Tax=Pseudocercospora musae TaxID=113226 RepID=A0A139HCC8_9PEZI|nr:hypothetical protein AC579_7202 [Pseudocercospora musae]